jgi:ABC-2 type transport system permease protein
LLIQFSENNFEDQKMKNIAAIARRELHSYFVSPLAYFIITAFLVVAGYFFSLLVFVFNDIVVRAGSNPFMQQPKPNLNEFVVGQLFRTMLVVLVFLVPLLTMRMVAEEKKQGTFELLLTSPISVFELVVGKFLGVSTVLIAMMAGTFLFPLLLMFFGDPAPEFMPMLVGIIGMTLCALAFASIGMAASAFAESQVVAGVVSMVTLLLLYVIQAPAQSIGGSIGSVLDYLSPVEQVRDMLRGVISLKSVVYFASIIVVGLFFSVRVLEKERWR